MRTLLGPADYRRQPWKNGLGVTLELARVPLPGDATRFLWRASIADVTADGPFSCFSGYDRHIAVIEGSGMALTVDGRTAEQRWMEQPFNFSGDADAGCRLQDGPIRDFNLMVDRASAQGRLLLLRENDRATRLAGHWVLVHALAGAVTVDGEAALSAGRTLLLTKAAVTVSAGRGARAACAEVVLND